MAGWASGFGAFWCFFGWFVAVWAACEFYGCLDVVAGWVGVHGLVVLVWFGGVGVVWWFWGVVSLWLVPFLAECFFDVLDVVGLVELWVWGDL